MSDRRCLKDEDRCVSARRVSARTPPATDATSSPLYYLVKLLAPHLHKQTCSSCEAHWDPSILVRVCSINSIADVCQPPHVHPTLLSSIFSALSPPSLHHTPPGHNHVLLVATSLRTCSCMDRGRRAECDRRRVFFYAAPAPDWIKNSSCCVGTGQVSTAEGRC